MTNRIKIQAMLDLQTSFNDKSNSKWRTADYQFVDTIWTEAAEAYDKTGWQWWKNSGQEIDFGQLKMEIIDILYCIINELLMHSETDEMKHADLLEMVYIEKIKEEDTKGKDKFTVEALRLALKDIIMYSLFPKDNNRIVYLVSAFIKVARILDMDWTELYKLYIGKNTLNSFRSNNGYKKDTAEYKARWYSVEKKGWEDNQFLTEFLKGADANGSVPAFQLSIINELQHLYNKATL